MTTSEPTSAFVWTWLPGAADPVVAGRLDVLAGDVVAFTYGRSFLERDGAVPIYLPELPLIRGRQLPAVGAIAGCIADAGPDAWGQRVIINRILGRQGVDPAELGVLTYLLNSGSDRVGALDFQASAEAYVPRTGARASLAELMEAADRVQAGVALTPALDDALLHGSSIGGARPKALLDDGVRKLIAKFSSTTDPYPVVQGEFIAMRLGAMAGLEVATVELTSAMDRAVLLVERFDRDDTGARRAFVSALTVLGLDEWSYRYWSYADLADQIRMRFVAPEAALHELFSRITFNILTGNTDDHARNHAAFWDGRTGELSLTPAYDIAPQPRAGGEARQAMAIGRDGWKLSQVAGCIDRAASYHLSAVEAREIVEAQIATIEDNWDAVCDAAGLSEVDRRYFWRRQFLNPFALEGLDR